MLNNDKFICRKLPQTNYTINNELRHTAHQPRQPTTYKSRLTYQCFVCRKTVMLKK